MYKMGYVHKIFVPKVLYSEGPIFRMHYVQKVLYPENT